MHKYIFIINIICFMIMGYDKNHAIHKKNRIPEATLIALSFLGGGIGSLLGMIIFHHKTKKIKFLLLVPISIIILILLIITK